MKMIDISTPKYPNTFAMVDDESFDRLNQCKWYCTCYGYAARRRSKDKSNSAFMHREIMRAKPGAIVDHIDGNKLNNQRSNLRFVNASQNRANMHVALSKSGYKGVRFQDGGWQATIKSNYRKIQIGTYKTPEEAALAYNKAAKEIHGEYAWPNTVEVKS